MKINLTVFLLKQGRQKADIFAAESKPKHTELALGNITADFYWKKSRSIPKWVQLIGENDAVDTTDMFGFGLQGLLVIQRNERIFCITFGHARHLINQMSIERYFGLRVALSLSDPELIKSIDKSNIDKTPLRSKAQSSKYLSIAEFEFKFDWEILKSLTGVVESDNDDDYEMVSGSDSVSLHTNITLNKIPRLIDRLWGTYNSEQYKQKYPWIDYIVPVVGAGLNPQVFAAELN